MNIWDDVKRPDESVLKPIIGGRLKGFTDINPMWRIQKLTELFGICGVGWYYTIDKQWTEITKNDEELCFVNASLFIKAENEWSKPIQGTGGSKKVVIEKTGLFNSDECYKMALTDALSVACKSLGFGADIYLKKFDGSKYINDYDDNIQNNTNQSMAASNLTNGKVIKHNLGMLFKEMNELIKVKQVNQEIIDTYNLIKENDWTQELLLTWIGNLKNCPDKVIKTDNYGQIVPYEDIPF